MFRSLPYIPILIKEFAVNMGIITALLLLYYDPCNSIVRLLIFNVEVESLDLKLVSDIYPLLLSFITV